MHVCNGNSGVYLPLFHTHVATGGEAEEGEASSTTVVFKGKAPVDSACKQKQSKVLYLHLT